MEILSSCTHPQVVPNLWSSVEHKRRYFKECWEPNCFWSPLTCIVFFFSVNCLVTNILQNIFFCVHHNWWHLWVNYSYKWGTNLYIWNIFAQNSHYNQWHGLHCSVSLFTSCFHCVCSDESMREIADHWKYCVLSRHDCVTALQPLMRQEYNAKYNATV